MANGMRKAKRQAARQERVAARQAGVKQERVAARKENRQEKRQANRAEMQGLNKGQKQEVRAERRAKRVANQAAKQAPQAMERPISQPTGAAGAAMEAATGAMGAGTQSPPPLMNTMEGGMGDVEQLPWDTSNPSQIDPGFSAGTYPGFEPPNYDAPYGSPEYTPRPDPNQAFQPYQPPQGGFGGSYSPDPYGVAGQQQQQNAWQGQNPNQSFMPQYAQGFSNAFNQTSNQFAGQPQPLGQAMQGIQQPGVKTGGFF